MYRISIISWKFDEANPILVWIFLFGRYLESYFEKIKKKFYKNIPSRFGFSSPSNSGIVVALSAFSELMFRVFLLGVQSSCITLVSLKCILTVVGIMLSTYLATRFFLILVFMSQLPFY